MAKTAISVSSFGMSLSAFVAAPAVAVRISSPPETPGKVGYELGRHLPRQGASYYGPICQQARNCREAMTMAITIYPVTPHFAAEIGDVDLSGAIEPSDIGAIKEAFAKYAVLIFPDQHLSQDQHLDFAKLFGPLETTIALYRKDAQLRVRKEFADVSNLSPDNKVWGKDSRQRMFQLGNRLWHTDSSFKRLPARASLLYARSIPPLGGHTEFADERAAYDALSDEMKRRLDGLVAEHSIFTSRGRLGFTNFSDEERRELPPVPQVVVRTIPETGRKSLYVASHAGHILGMPEA